MSLNWRSPVSRMCGGGGGGGGLGEIRACPFLGKWRNLGTVPYVNSPRKTARSEAASPSFTKSSIGADCFKFSACQPIASCSTSFKLREDFVLRKTQQVLVDKINMVGYFLARCAIIKSKSLVVLKKLDEMCLWPYQVQLEWRSRICLSTTIILTKKRW